MESEILKRSIVIAHHKTSVSLEDQFWNALKEIADARQADDLWPCDRDQNRTPAWQSVFGYSPIRSCLLS
jgi:hypothetical protein